MKENRKAKGRR